MKNLDIENWERKTPYSTPENFFGQMQENVLRETVNKRKENPIFNLNWVYAAAAAVAMIFGITFFNSSEQNSATKLTSQNQENIQETAAGKDETAEMLADNEKPATEEKIAYQTLVQDLTSVPNDNQIKRKAENQPAKQNTVTAVSNVNPEADMDQILANFTPEELKAISKNSEQDVYLDLYN